MSNDQTFTLAAGETHEFHTAVQKDFTISFYAARYFSERVGVHDFLKCFDEENIVLLFIGIRRNEHSIGFNSWDKDQQWGVETKVPLDNLFNNIDATIKVIVQESNFAIQIDRQIVCLWPRRSPGAIRRVSFEWDAGLGDGSLCSPLNVTVSPTMV